MCGVAGVFELQGGGGRERATERTAIVERMMDALVHRGPDDAGRYSDPHIALGHRRLSIIDLDSGHQPIANEDESVWVILNGEIYNYRDLRSQLEAKGHRFGTRSDTESIVHAYEEWGPACVERLRGMFAFALWDVRERRLLLARDRIGQKPLYYAVGGGQLAFASEIKALLAWPALRRDLDWTAFSDYLSLLYIPREKSIFSQVRKLLPAHYLLADASGVRTHRYWQLEFSADSITASEAAGRVSELLDDAVQTRLQSDVPVGAFLSGGLDSSAVVAAMARHMQRPVDTSSIGFADAAYDESSHAREVARNLASVHSEEQLAARAVEDIERLTWHYDEPFGDSSAIPTYHVSQLARRRVTVALSGDGGDESFAGYRRYYFDVRENRVRDWIPASIRQPFFALAGAIYPKADYLPQVFRGKAFLSNLARTPWEAYLHSVSGVDAADKERLLSAELRAELADYRTASLFEELYDSAPANDALSRIQYVDLMTYLPDDILTKVDRASMACSLEVRSPLVDHHLVEYAASLPANLKMSGSQTKMVLKEAVRGTVPDSVLERPKMGFAMPLDRWMRGDLRSWLQERLIDDPPDHGLFERATVADFWRQHQSGLRDRTTELWGVLVFDQWYRRFMQRDGAEPLPTGEQST